MTVLTLYAFLYGKAYLVSHLPLYFELDFGLNCDDRHPFVSMEACVASVSCESVHL